MEDNLTQLNVVSSVAARGITDFKFEFYKQLYYDEIQTRHQLSSKLGIILTALLALITASIWCINKFADIYVFNSIRTIAFEGIVLTNICICVAVCMFIQSYRHYKAAYILPSAVKELFQNKTSGTADNATIVYEIKNELADAYIDAAISNFRETEKHTKFLNYTIYLLVVSIILMFATFLAIINI